MRPLIYHFNIASMLSAIFYSFVGILSAALSRRSPLRFREDDKQTERPSNKICTGSHDRLMLKSRLKSAGIGV